MRQILFVLGIFWGVTAFAGQYFLFTNSGNVPKDVVLTCPAACYNVVHGQTSVCYSATVYSHTADEYYPGWLVKMICPHQLNSLSIFPEGSNVPDYQASPIPYGDYDVNTMKAGK